MNLKAITAPLADKIESLVELVQEMKDNIEEQTTVQKEILVTIIEIDEKLTTENICKNPKDQ